MLHATPLLVALVFIEVSDIIFAIDSVPAIFAMTHEPLIVFTSNIFAILGLRALYFLLAGAIEKFTLLKYGLALVLIFVGLKMVWLNAAFGGKFPIGWSLGIIPGSWGPRSRSRCCARATGRSEQVAQPSRYLPITDSRRPVLNMRSFRFRPGMGLLEQAIADRELPSQPPPDGRFGREVQVGAVIAPVVEVRVRRVFAQNGLGVRR